MPGDVTFSLRSTLILYVSAPIDDTAAYPAGVHSTLGEDLDIDVKVSKKFNEWFSADIVYGIDNNLENEDRDQISSNPHLDTFREDQFYISLHAKVNDDINMSIHLGRPESVFDTFSTVWTDLQPVQMDLMHKFNPALLPRMVDLDDFSFYYGSELLIDNAAAVGTQDPDAAVRYDFKYKGFSFAAQTQLGYNDENENYNSFNREPFANYSFGVGYLHNNDFAINLTYAHSELDNHGEAHSADSAGSVEWRLDGKYKFDTWAAVISSGKPYAINTHLYTALGYYYRKLSSEGGRDVHMLGEHPMDIHDEYRWDITQQGIEAVAWYFVSPYHFGPSFQVQYMYLKTDYNRDHAEPHMSVAKYNAKTIHGINSVAYYAFSPNFTLYIEWYKNFIKQSSEDDPEKQFMKDGLALGDRLDFGLEFKI